MCYRSQCAIGAVCCRCQCTVSDNVLYIQVYCRYYKCSILQVQCVWWKNHWIGLLVLYCVFTSLFWTFLIVWSLTSFLTSLSLYFIIFPKDISNLTSLSHCEEKNEMVEVGLCLLAEAGKSNTGEKVGTGDRPPLPSRKEAQGEPCTTWTRTV